MCAARDSFNLLEQSYEHAIQNIQDWLNWIEIDLRNWLTTYYYHTVVCRNQRNYFWYFGYSTEGLLFHGGFVIPGSYSTPGENAPKGPETIDMKEDGKADRLLLVQKGFRVPAERIVQVLHRACGANFTFEYSRATTCTESPPIEQICRGCCTTGAHTSTPPTYERPTGYS
jgi:hypothetical protein